MNVEFILNLASTLVAIILSSIGSWLFFARRMPASYRVAVIGFPQVGKTTLITAVFAYLFRRGIRGASIVPRGEETISRVNANMEALELGHPIGPTRDQDVFAYRAEVSVPTILGRRRYKLEIGDFPGEDSVSFTEANGPWLHRTNYFEWAISADAFIFVIDAAAAVHDDTGQYAARQKSALRAAWQRLQEYHLVGPTDIRSKPLVLAFAKVDLLLQSNRNRGEIESADIDKVTHLAVRDFGDLIDYFRRDNSRFEVVLTSAIATVGGERIGIPKIAKYLMPRSRSHPASQPSSTK